MNDKIDHSEHRQRLKKRFKKAGRIGLADYEMLELLLTYAIPRKDVKQLAKNIIHESKSLKNVFDCSYDDLEKINGISEHSAILIKLVKDLMIQYFEPDIEKKPTLSSPESVSAFLQEEKLIYEDQLNSYLKSELGNKEREFFMVLCLNSSNQLIFKDIIFSGTIDQAQVYPREILKIAIIKNASALILVHNHPSGNSKPSEDDLILTKKLEDLSKEFGLRIHDHIVVCREKAFSIRANRFI